MNFSSSPFRSRPESSLKTFNYTCLCDRVRLITKWFGVFLVYGHEIREYALFPKDASEIASRLLKIRNGEILAEERRFSEQRPRVGERRLSEIGRFRDEKRIVDIRPEDYGFDMHLLHEALIIAGREEVEASKNPSNDIIQAINAMDEIIESQNILSERLKEWYGYHHPFDELVEGKKIKEIGGGLSSLNSLMNKSAETRSDMEKYLREIMEESAPNLNALVGPTIGARLIAMAGSVRNLASMPSSTIQVLGAETAFFRFLKEGTKPPKHGIIYQHPIIHRARRDNRGRISRFMAGKIRIAAALDANHGDFMGDALLESVRKRADELERRGKKSGKKGRKKKRKRK